MRDKTFVTISRVKEHSHTGDRKFSSVTLCQKDLFPTEEMSTSHEEFILEKSHMNVPYAK